MASIFKFFSSLLAKIVGFAEWILLVFKQVFVDIWNMFTDLFCWVLDQAMQLAASLLNTIDVPFNPQTYYSMIPAEAAQMMGYIGITQALTMIVAALIIRFTLQTIPLVRWGS